MMIFPWRFLLERCGMMRRMWAVLPTGREGWSSVGMRKTGD